MNGNRASLSHSLRYSPLCQLVLARLRESYRRPETVFWVYVFPILMVVALGIAFRNTPVERFVVDVHDGPGAQEVVAALTEDSRIVAQVRDQTASRTRVRTGKSDLVVARDPSGSTGYRYVYLLDPTRPNSVMARDVVNQLLQRAAGRVDPAAVEDVVMDEPGGRYIDFLVPGLLGMSLMGGGLWGVGFVTVDMRIRKLLKRLVATPMKKRHFLLGIMVSRLAFMVPEVILLLAFARLVFGVIVHGSWVAVVFLILLGALTFSGVGLLVASRANTLEAVTGLMNLVMLPMWILSGIFFSSERFPEFAQPLIKLLPLTPLIDALRSIMLEGATLASQLGQITILTLWAAVTFTLALWWFRWT
jgi:ABC-type multidrug transport system permease subunit